MSPRPDVSEERRRQILDAALAVFARSGFSRARVEDIARETGLSKGTLYLYFDGKEAIIHAILERLFTLEMEDLEAIERAEGPVGERLLLLTRHFTADVERLQALFPVIYEFYAMAARQEAHRAFFQKYFKVYRESLAGLVQQGIDRGEFHAVDAGDVAIAIGSIYEGLALLWMVDPQAVQLEEQGAGAIRLLLRGLRRESE